MIYHIPYTFGNTPMGTMLNVALFIYVICTQPISSQEMLEDIDRNNDKKVSCYQCGCLQKENKELQMENARLLRNIEQLYDLIKHQVIKSLPDIYWILFDGSLYYFGNDTKNWGEAVEFCKDIGSHLAVILSLEENNFLVNYTNAHYKSSLFWLDGTDVSNEGQWIWNSTGRNITFSNWNEEYGEPNGSTEENCLELYYYDEYEWNDTVCSARNNFICEKEI